MPKYRMIENRRAKYEETFELHDAKCADIRKKLRKGGYNDGEEIESVCIDQALDKFFDEYRKSLDWTKESCRVMPCCKKY